MNAKDALAVVRDHAKLREALATFNAARGEGK